MKFLTALSLVIKFLIRPLALLYHGARYVLSLKTQDNNELREIIGREMRRITPPDCPYRTKD